VVKRARHHQPTTSELSSLQHVFIDSSSKS
jgi:hypothetical protein